MNQKIGGNDSIALLQQMQDQTLHFDQVSILRTCICPNYFPEHSNPQVKIAIPLQPASIQATWQTASGRQRQQHNELPRRKRTGYQNQKRANCSSLCNLR